MMRKFWLIAAIALMLVGAVLFTVVMSVLGWDFTKLSTQTLKTKDHMPMGEFLNIRIQTADADVRILPSVDGLCHVVCSEQEKAEHSVALSEGELVIRCVDTRQWYDYIGINLSRPSVTVYVPEWFGGELTVQGGTGDVRVENLWLEKMSLTLTTGDVTVTDTIVAGAATVHLTTGDVELENLWCNMLVSSGSTGDVRMDKVDAAEIIRLERTTGDIGMSLCDAMSLRLETTTGDVTGSLRSGKKFVTQSTTGKVSVPADGSGGKCTITVTTGNIEIEVAQ